MSSLRTRCVSAAKELIGRAGRSVAHEAVQMHGGMGMTDELSIGHYFKRLAAIDATFGEGDLHLDRFCAADAGEVQEPVAKAAKKWKQLV